MTSWPFAEGVQFDSWLTAAEDQGNLAGAIGTIGIVFSTWTPDSPLFTDNGAIFWMSPDDEPTHCKLYEECSAVIAQITIPTENTNWGAECGAQGRVMSGLKPGSLERLPGGHDWQMNHIGFGSMAGVGSVLPNPVDPPPPPPRDPPPPPPPPPPYVPPPPPATGQTYYVNVTGSATIDTSSRSGVSAQAMTWDLSGADTSGGIHIHDGTSCAVCSATTCGHYFDSATVHGVDPWPASTYTSDADGHAAAEGPTILTGLDAAAIEGKIVVVHDSTGTRVACSLISSTQSAPVTPVIGTGHWAQYRRYGHTHQPGRLRLGGPAGPGRRRGVRVLPRAGRRPGLARRGRGGGRLRRAGDAHLLGRLRGQAGAAGERILERSAAGGALRHGRQCPRR